MWRNDSFSPKRAIGGDVLHSNLPHAGTKERPTPFHLCVGHIGTMPRPRMICPHLWRTWIHWMPPSQKLWKSAETSYANVCVQDNEQKHCYWYTAPALWTRHPANVLRCWQWHRVAFLVDTSKEELLEDTMPCLWLALLIFHTSILAMGVSLTVFDEAIPNRCGW